MVERKAALLVLSIGSLALVLMAVGCDRKLPSPWNEMQFPVRNGEILPGADQTGVQVLYRGIAAHNDLYREYSKCLERAGYAHDSDGKENDPGERIYSAFFKRGSEQIKLHIQGTTHTTVKLTKVN